MKTLTIDGVDYCNTSELDAEIRVFAGNALQLVTFEPAANNRVTITLDVESITGDEERMIRNAVNVHLSRLAQVEAARLVQLDAEVSDVNARFVLSALNNRTPEQIYTLMQNRIDGWGNLAQAKADLREWLPLMAALIAVKLQKREG